MNYMLKKSIFQQKKNQIVKYFNNAFNLKVPKK